MKVEPWLVTAAVLSGCGSPPAEKARPTEHERARQADSPIRLAQPDAPRMAGFSGPSPAATPPPASPSPSAEEIEIAAANRACIEGKGDRCFQLARILERRATISETSPSDAISSYHQACRFENVAGCLRLGEIYSTDEYLLKRPEDAVRYFTAACERGDAAGCDAAKRLQARPEPGATPTPAPSPEDLTVLACEGGSVDACLRVGQMYETGAGRPVDLERAAQLYRKVCRHSGQDARGCNNASRLYRSGAWPGRDPAVAARYSQRACDLFSHDMLGLYKQMADAALSGCKDLARMYDTGEGVERDITRAAELFSKTCSTYDAESCYEAGLRFRRGEGVPGNEAVAIRLFETACKEGEPRGCAALGR
jgi:uncharacterized protein